MTLEEYRKKLTGRFEEKLFDCAGIEADYIISEVLSIPHIELVLYPERLIKDEELSRMESFAERRLKHEPFQYIFGWTPFRKIDLYVAPGVLIPRPETEGMVDIILKNLPQRGTLCELGTGSGAISLSVAYERSDVKVMGSEISPEALVISEKNRRKLSLENVQFFQGDLYSPFAGNTFDVIAANLPYIPREEEKNLPPNVRDYEPKEALFADDGGFALIEKAILEAPRYLKKDSPSALVFELGEEQTLRAVETAEKTAFFIECKIEKDVFQVPRFLYAVHQ